MQLMPLYARAAVRAGPGGTHARCDGGQNTHWFVTGWWEDRQHLCVCVCVCVCVVCSS